MLMTFLFLSKEKYIFFDLFAEVIVDFPVDAAFRFTSLNAIYQTIHLRLEAACYFLNSK